MQTLETNHFAALSYTRPLPVIKGCAPPIYCYRIILSCSYRFEDGFIFRFIRQSGGYSFLYADVFLSEEEFNAMFDLTLYNQCRKKYGAENAFPCLYNKIKPEVDVFKIGKEYANSE